MKRNLLKLSYKRLTTAPGGRVTRIALPVLYFFIFLFFAVQGRAQTFVPAANSEFVFPLPTTTAILPGGSSSAYPFVGFYNNHFRGAAYNCEIPVLGINRDLLLWGSNFGDISGTNAILAFKITNSTTDTSTYMRGMLAMPADITEMQLSVVSSNGTFFVLAAYWTSSGYVLDIFTLDTNPYASTAGLNLYSSTVLNSAPITARAGRISMFGYDYKTAGIIWEEPGTGLFAKAVYTDLFGGIYIGNTFALPSTNSCLFPDVTSGASAPAGFQFHFVFVDTASLEIKEAKMAVYDLVNYPLAGAASYSVEDVESISTYGSNWDDFQLRIATPLFSTYTTGWFGTGSWAYTYYNNDAHKIRVRTQSATSPPTTYVVNDGSLGNGDISMAGNAFPAITYTADNKVCVGWYTTYDPANPAGANPLYSYSTDSKRYIAVEMREDGSAISDYLQVSRNYLNNHIGEGFSRGWGWEQSGYPWIVFGKRTYDHVFAAYSCHGNTEIWNGYGYPIFSGYYCYPRDPYFSSVVPGEASYVATKLLSNVSPPVFRLAQPVVAPVSLLNNPFTDSRVFQLEGDNSISYVVEMTSVDGRKIYQATGMLSEINRQLQTGSMGALQPGLYMLHLESKGLPSQTFKLVKQ